MCRRNESKETRPLPSWYSVTGETEKKSKKQMVDAKEETNGATGMTVERTLEMVV